MDNGIAATMTGNSGATRFVRWQCSGGMLLMLALLPAVAADTEGVTATPYRPTVSNPADLSAPGFFELEAGWQRSTRSSEAAKQSSLPWLLKYAFSDRFGLLIGGEAALSVTDDAGDTLRGNGDTTFTAKFKFPHTESMAWGLEVTRKFPTASTGLGSDKVDWILNGIYSTSVAEYAIDINLGVTRLGLQESGLARQEYSWAMGAAHELAGAWGAALELSGTRREGAPSTRQFLAAVSHTFSANTVLDIGVAWGLNDASADATVFAGFTRLLR